MLKLDKISSLQRAATRVNDFILKVYRFIYYCLVIELFHVPVDTFVVVDTTGMRMD